MPFYQGTSGADSLKGGNGNDILKGLGGADTLDGGSGRDGVSYLDSPEGVQVTLSTGQGFGGSAEGDHLISIEDVGGSWYGDFLVGNHVSNELTGYGGNDTLKGGGGIDYLYGGDGDDILNGEAGADQVYGGIGNDTYIVDDLNDLIFEKAGEGYDEVASSGNYFLPPGQDIEVLRALNPNGTAPLQLYGNASGNVVIGNNGNNVLSGGGGNDELTGGAGQDTFLFYTPMGPGNVDEITDFNVADDTIQLSLDIYSTGNPFSYISVGEFVLGVAAQDDSDRIIYDPATGILRYDPDGSAPAPAVHFATLSPNLALTHQDFFITL
jgi:Ca2+-binding RTX toxin-like protein